MTVVPQEKVPSKAHSIRDLPSNTGDKQSACADLREEWHVVICVRALGHLTLHTTSQPYATHISSTSPP